MIGLVCGDVPRGGDAAAGWTAIPIFLQVERAFPGYGADTRLDTFALATFLSGAQVTCISLGQWDHTGLADAHPAAERHLDSQVLTGLEKCGGTIEFGGLLGSGEGDGTALATEIGPRDGETFDVQLIAEVRRRVRRLDVVEEGDRPACPAGPFPPIGTFASISSMENLPSDLVSCSASEYVGTCSSRDSSSSRKMTSSRVGAE